MLPEINEATKNTPNCLCRVLSPFSCWLLLAVLSHHLVIGWVQLHSAQLGVQPLSSLLPSSIFHLLLDNGNDNFKRDCNAGCRCCCCIPCVELLRRPRDCCCFANLIKIFSQPVALSPCTFLADLYVGCPCWESPEREGKRLHSLLSAASRRPLLQGKLFTVISITKYWKCLQEKNLAVEWMWIKQWSGREIGEECGEMIRKSWMKGKVVAKSPNEERVETRWQRKLLLQRFQMNEDLFAA